MALALVLLLIPNIGVGAWWGPVYGGVQTMAPPAMRALSAAVLLFVINMIGLGGGPTAFGMTTDAMTNHYLAGTGFDVQTCRTAVGAAKATCAAASAHGIKITVYLSTAISRPARRADVAAILRLLADDGLGAGREVVSDPPSAAYFEAFDAIAANPRALLAVAEGQLTFIAGLSNQGAELALVSAVRIAVCAARASAR